MSSLHISLLSAPQVNVDGAPVTVESRKALALIFYLAASGEHHHRDRLATLFWPEQDQQRARSSLRHVLWLLRKTGMESWLISEQDSLTLRAGYTCDLHQFRTLLDEGQLAEAVALYRDDFLAGFTLRDCPEFDDWHFWQADALRRQLADALSALVQRHAADAPSAALDYARRLLSLDPLAEPVHRTLMQLYAEDGQYSAALRQYEICAQMLADEFGAPPDPETDHLLQRIREAKGRGRDEINVPAVANPRRSTDLAAPSAPPGDRQRSNLPSQPTPFVGRQREIADIVHHLTDPTCRFLTLVGPGGIGKTRLALQVAQHLLEADAHRREFADGVFFVSLASIQSPTEIVSAISHAIGFQLYKGVSPRAQILDYLSQKRLLLVLDNVEHLLDGVDLIAEILAAAPPLKVLATSREALNLRNAWFYPVDGMALPSAEEAAAEAAARDALRLFAQSARRARPDFDLRAEQAEALRVCRLVGGMPLAIELAAAWSRTLSCAQIVHELEHSLDILADRYRDLPERHRSMRASLEQSWQMLSPDEQRILRRLSIFNGGFGSAAAQSVAGASLLALATLVDKSFLRVAQDGRYQMHELLHQFAREKGETNAAELERVRAEHSRHYLDFLADREQALVGEQPQAIMAQIAGDLENIRAAWGWAAAHGDWERIERSLDTLFRFYWIRAAGQEAKDLLTRTVDQLNAQPSLAADRRLAVLRVKLEQRRLMFDFFLGNYAVVQEKTRACIAAAADLNLQRELGFAYNLLGVIAGMEGDAPAAEQHLRQSIDLFAEIDDETGLADSLHELALIQCNLNANYAEAARLASESLHISRRLGRLDWIAHALDALAFAHFCMGHYGNAELNYTESMALFEQANHALGRALALGGLGLVAWGRGGDALPQAQTYLEESLSICRNLGHPLYMSSRLYLLAQVNNDLGHYQQAERYARQGFSMAQRLGSAAFMSYNLCALIEIACATGQYQRAHEHLSSLCAYVHDVQPQLLLVTLLHRASLLIAENPGTQPSQRAARQEALELLLFVQQHPAALHLYARRAARVAEELRSTLPPDWVSAAAACAATRTLRDVIDSQPWASIRSFD